MQCVYLHRRGERYRAFSALLALVIILGLACAVYFVQRHMKATTKDPDLCDDLKPWKEWRLRQASKKPEQAVSPEQPDIREAIQFDTNVSEQDTDEPRGELSFAILPGGRVSGQWYGFYHKKREISLQILTGDFEGKVWPGKVCRDEAGQEDPSKLYLMAKGRFLMQETNSKRKIVTNRAGDIYVRGWLSPKYSATGEVTITSNEKYFETFTWKCSEPVTLFR